ncbi:alpha/beta hydrolase [Herbidospora galbida]|uniref:Alpha/beta hydrolase n=2 Tax=Herbidospora galbida TaxID=2575442 RepID=A0A4V5UYI9_9ACTN|nr:alpha/beta hydrolase [Herbidospora galbida]
MPARHAATPECAQVRVPLDPAQPGGQQITIALNRFKGSAPRDGNHLGPLLVNPGGPGASGLALARHVAASLPPEVAARYDVIGFDPRGVGASKPALTCVDPKRYYAPPRPDNVPADAAAERVLLGRAETYAAGCGNRFAWLLPYMTTENAARDVEALRRALGEEKISWLGYSYGTYLGSVYATLFPDRVRRMVLDSVVDPTKVWYDANLDQNVAFDDRHRDFLDWVADNNDLFRLGDTEEDVSFAWYGMRKRLAERPAGGVVGPSELDDTFTVGGYTDAVWATFARAFSDYVRKGDVTALVNAYRQHGENDAADENGYAVYLATQCRDAAWPRDWSRWRTDARRLYARSPFMTWSNTVYNLPCAFWPQAGGTPVAVGANRSFAPILILQSRRDAATPLRGALTVRDRFPSARMLLVGGGNHGVSFGGNPCVDRQVAAYLKDGLLPERRRPGSEPDLTCPSAGARAATRMASTGGDPTHETLTQVLLGR